MPSPDFLTFFSRNSHEKTGEISHFLITPIGGENEKKSLTYFPTQHTVMQRRNSA